MKTIYFLIFSIALLSCQKEKTSLPIEENSIAISSQLKTDKLQTFEFILKNDTLISGKEGTKIWIPRDLFENYSNGKITFELKEFYSKEDMILNGLSTVTDKDELLESSGMFYINFKEDDKQLKIKNGKSYKVETPNKPLADSNIYYNDNDSIFRWELGKSKLKVLYPDILRNHAFRISVGKDGIGGFFKVTTLDSLKIAQKIDSLKIIEIINKELSKDEALSELARIFLSETDESDSDINNDKTLSEAEKSYKLKNRKQFHYNFSEIYSFTDNKLGWINIDEVLEYEVEKNIILKNTKKYNDYSINLIYLNNKSLLNHNLNEFKTHSESVKIVGKIKVVIYANSGNKIMYDSFYIDKNSKSEFDLNFKETTLDKLKQELISK